MSIVEQYSAGMSTLEIAEDRNWSVSSVRNYLLNAGVKLRGRGEWRKMYPEKWSRYRSSICSRPGCCNKRIEPGKPCRECWNRYHRERRTNERPKPTEENSNPGL